VEWRAALVVKREEGERRGNARRQSGRKVSGAAALAGGAEEMGTSAPWSRGRGLRRHVGTGTGRTDLLTRSRCRFDSHDRG
jgi:hypothetical protein